MSKENVSKAAAELGKLGASKGGKARAQALSPERRSEIARNAVDARWEAAGRGMPRETHTGILRIGDREIPCSVLDNGLRVFSTRGVSRVVGSRTKGLKEKDKDAFEGGAPQMPPFLASPTIRPFISNDLMAPLISPVQYKPQHGGRTAFGYEATLLPRICEVILDAKKAGAKRIEHLAETAEILIRGFARVGVIALVDEATGYQEDRARDELSKILEAYISEALRPWVKRFPNEFFRETYRLHGWEYKPGNCRRPMYVGKLINRYIYEQLPPQVLPELRRINPPDDNGRRKHKHFQFLTDETGVPHLDKQIAVVTTLMKIAPDKATFDDLFDRAFSNQGRLPLIVSLIQVEETSEEEKG